MPGGDSPVPTALCTLHTAVIASVPHTLKYNDDTGHAYDAKGMLVVPVQERTLKIGPYT